MRRLHSTRALPGVVAGALLTLVAFAVAATPVTPPTATAVTAPAATAVTPPTATPVTPPTTTAVTTPVTAPAATAEPAPTVTPVTAPAPTSSVSAPAGEAGEVMLPVEEYRLSNGLRVILAPDEALPNVAVHVRYDVGSKDDPEGLTGIAHVVEHLMFERSLHVPQGALMRILSDAGATQLNAHTTFDSTEYYELVPPEQLELALWLESDRMGFFLPAIDKAALEQERVVVTTEMRTRYYDQPAGRMPIFIFDATFPAWHPYHSTPIGDYDELQRLSMADVRAFAATWYGPDNASLILVGRFRKERAVALVERYFATLKSRPPPKRPALPALATKGPTRLEVRANQGEEAAYLNWITPVHGAPGDAALDWVAKILATGSSGRLHDRLVTKRVASDVSASQWSLSLASVFQIQVSGMEDIKGEDLVKVIDEELAGLAAKGPTPEEMKQIDHRLSGQALFALESASQRAATLAMAAGLGPIEVPFDWTRRKRREVTAEDVRAAAARLTSTSRAGVVMLRPSWAAPRWGTVIDREEP